MESDNILKITVRFTMPGIIFFFLKVDNILMLSNINNPRSTIQAIASVGKYVYRNTCNQCWYSDHVDIETLEKLGLFLPG